MHLRDLMSQSKIASSYGCLSPLTRILHRLSTKNIQENTHIYSNSCYKEVRKYCAEMQLIMEFWPPVSKDFHRLEHHPWREMGFVGTLAV